MRILRSFRLGNQCYPNNHVDADLQSSLSQLFFGSALVENLAFLETHAAVFDVEAFCSQGLTRLSLPLFRSHRGRGPERSEGCRPECGSPPRFRRYAAASNQCELATIFHDRQPAQAKA